MSTIKILRFFSSCLIIAASLSGTNVSHSIAHAQSNSEYILGPLAPDAICTYRTAVFSDSPFGYWRLGEVGGTTADNIGSLGSTLHGTYQPDVIFIEDSLIIGEYNPAVGFAGSANSYVIIPSDNSIEAQGPYNAKTVELWFKASAPLASGKQVLYEQGGEKNGLNIYLDGNSLYAGAYATPVDPGDTYGTWVNTPILADTIYHVVLVFDGSSQTVAGYANGTIFGIATTNFTQIETAYRGNGVGGVNDYTLFHDGAFTELKGKNFTGIIDEVALYNRALSPSRIQLHAQGCVAQSCQYQEKVDADVPIAYWRLGELIGTTAFNYGSLFDIYGTYNNGVTLGMGSLVALDPDMAAGFDGVDDFVSIPNHSHINLFGPHVAKTIELWFKADILTGKRILYEQGGIHKGLNIYLNGTQLTVGAWNNDTGAWVATAVTAGIPYHVALTYDGSSRLVTGYLNGVNFGSADIGYDAIDGHDGAIGIGAVNNETRWSNSEATTLDGWNFKGVIDEVALHNIVLSQERISAHAGGCSATAIALSSFDVASSIGEVRLSWETVMEMDAIGFNLFRSSNLDGERIKLNSDLIPSQAPGEVIGATYEYLDKNVQFGQEYYYWLEFIDTGGPTVFGPQPTKAAFGLFMPAILH
jgi:hypothetical protein